LYTTKTHLIPAAHYVGGNFPWTHHGQCRLSVGFLPGFTLVKMDSAVALQLGTPLLYILHLLTGVYAQLSLSDWHWFNTCHFIPPVI
jgi:hypothetical protein